MRRKNLAMDDVSLLPPGGGFLLVEMGAWDAAEAHAKAKALAHAAQGWAEAPAARIYSAEDAAAVWRVRESALGATAFVPGEPERFEGWDDAGIPPRGWRLPAPAHGSHGRVRYRSPLYGHYGQGCVHLRINFDFRTVEGVRRFASHRRAADLVLSLGGSLSGEHGDGQARAALLPKMFGPELIRAFQEFKAIWDPANRMNPGKLSDRCAFTIGGKSASRAVRCRRDAATLETTLVFAADQGSLNAPRALRGRGRLPEDRGRRDVPQHRATGEEQHSTRGRARLLWEMLAGALRKEGFQSKAVHEALDLCLSARRARPSAR